MHGRISDLNKIPYKALPLSFFGPQCQEMNESSQQKEKVAGIDINMQTLRRSGKT